MSTPPRIDRPAQLSLPGIKPGRSKLSRAALAQIERSTVDETLTAIARDGHPTVAWWWGMREVGDQFGAFCYVCDELVTTWSRKWPITNAAKEIVHAHRANHAPDVTNWLAVRR